MLFWKVTVMLSPVESALVTRVEKTSARTPEVAEPADRDPVVGVGGAGPARARAELGRIADRGRGATHGRRGEEGVGRTGGGRPRAGFRHVARAGRGAAHGARVPRRVRAGRAGAVAEVARAEVTVVGARGT